MAQAVWARHWACTLRQQGLAGFQGPPRNLFVQQCQSAFAREYRRAVIAQLRQLAEMTTPNAEAQKRFNTEGPNQ